MFSRVWITPVKLAIAKSGLFLSAKLIFQKKNNKNFTVKNNEYSETFIREHH